MVERAISGVASRFEVACQGLPRLVTPCRGLRLGCQRGFGGGGSDDGEQRRPHGVVDAQATEADATWLAVVEPPAGADSAGGVVLGAGMLDGEFLAAAATAQQSREQRGAVLGHAVRVGSRDVLAHHRPDRLRVIPLDVTFVRAGLQCQPVRTCPAPGAGLRPSRRRCIQRGGRHAAGGGDGVFCSCRALFQVAGKAVPTVGQRVEGSLDAPA